MDLKEGYINESSGKTKRYCQFIRLNSETIDQYKYWHKSKNVWKEIPVGIRKAGIIDMEIYVINDTAFMIIETPTDFEWDSAFGKLATYERQAEWEEFTSRFQITKTSNRSEEKWQLIERIFSLSEALKEI